jgi:hypothetical protein
MPPARKQDLKPQPKPKKASALEDQVESILRQLNELSSEHARTRRGATTANKVASQTSKKVDEQEKRIGLLEAGLGTVDTILGKITEFTDRFRGHDEDLANHEERITRLEGSAGSESRGIFLVWLVTVLVTEAAVFLGWLNMAGLRNGAGRKLGDIAGYDTVFTWAAVAVFVVITAVTLVVRAGEPRGSSSTPPRQVPKKIREAEEVSQESDRVYA